jgi:intein/homing endonuclease
MTRSKYDLKTTEGEPFMVRSEDANKGNFNRKVPYPPRVPGKYWIIYFVETKFKLRGYATKTSFRKQKNVGATKTKMV